VSDRDIPTSGSRWEPADGASHEIAPQPTGSPGAPPTVPAEQTATEHTSSEHDATSTDETVVMAEHGGTPAEDGVVRGRRALLRRRLRNRSALAAAGVGLVLAGGLGGFAVGRALSDSAASGISTDAEQHGLTGGPRDGGRGGRPDVDRDGDRQDAPGTVPDGSTPDDSNSSPGGDEGGTS
jgi:hypothetical protein